MPITATSTEEQTLTRRQVILRDSAVFLSLSLIVLALFFTTLFLFRSFTEHRAVLARRWLDRGQADLAHGRAAQAVNSLQVALDYGPDDPAAELLLAQALGASGHTDEAYNYFIELWETQPGSGLINLELARLAVRKGEPQQAVNDYRAALYGTWEGDGAQRRLAVRLELARYLLQHKETEAARAELLVAGGNAAGDAATDMTIGELLEKAADPDDAARLYQRAAHNEAASAVALGAEGRIAYQAGNYMLARHLLGQALGQSSSSLPPTHVAKLKQMLRLTEDVLASNPSANLSNAERVRRIVAAREIARRRLEACTRDASHSTPELAALAARWSAKDALPPPRALLKDTDRQETAIRLTYETADATAKGCSVEQTDDDQALALLAHVSVGGLN